MPDIVEVVILSIAKIVKCDSLKLTIDTRLAEDLMLKSVSRMELAAILEDQLNVSISNFDIFKPRTIGQIVEMIQKKF